MLGDALRSIFHREGSRVTGSAPPPAALRGSAKPVPASSRPSRGLEQFFFSLRDVVGLHVLDCGGANHDNVNFLISLGHKAYTQDLVRSIDDTFGPDPADQTNAGQIKSFVAQNLGYPEYTFDGVLLWDALQFMSPAVLTATVDRLYEVMRPNSYLLAFFSASERATKVPSYSFHIVDSKTMVVTDRGERPAGQVFNNRNLERLFGRFDSVKFFLTRDNLREVIVRR